MEKTRIIWVDNVKILAIFLVALGHMLMGLFDAGVFTAETYPQGFVSYIYVFHVPLFFMCSGFIYQQFTKTDGFKDYSRNLLKKLVALGIPYFVFVSVTYVIKTVFSSSVNHSNRTGLIDMLFCNLSAPYWFLYALFLLFAVSPVFKRKSVAIIGIIAAAALNVVYLTFGFGFMPRFPAVICGLICENLYFFLLGMAVSFFGISRYFRKSGALLFVLFTALFILMQKAGVDFTGEKLILATIACTGIISFFGASLNGESRVTAFLSKYVMPVFLMHTIFAAGVRIVLIKLGITSLFVHLFAGLAASLVLPIAAAFVMEKIKLDFLYSPTKYIKIK